MINKDEPTLEIRNLHVEYKSRRGCVRAVTNVSLSIYEGQSWGIVGESGCGKSTMALAIMGYLGASGHIASGEIFFHGRDLRKISPAELRRIYGNRISMVYQDPQAALNPSMRIGDQLGEILQYHLGLSRLEAWKRSLDILDLVRLPDPVSVAKRYPHQLSGGMQQRVVIAMAICCDPDILIMDEPTTGLDVTTEAQILDLVSELKAEVKAAILYISHNLAVVANLCDYMAVIYSGEVVETGSVERIFHRQAHPYTMDLLGCVPQIVSRSEKIRQLRPIEGELPRADAMLAPSCIYQPRCKLAREKCRTDRPVLIDIAPDHRSSCFYWNDIGKAKLSEGEMPFKRKRSFEGLANLLETRDLEKTFDERHRRFFLFGPLTGRLVRAVNGLSMNISSNETVALVGESGCGKTTLARCIAGLDEPTNGKVEFAGKDITKKARKRSIQIRRGLQIVFQNPTSSLNPRHTVAQIVGRPLILLNLARGNLVRERVIDMLDKVKLDATYADRYPNELSGGEKQRVAIARAFVADPSLVICDEAVSSLDVSVQASILNLLDRLQQEAQTAFLFISHDLCVVQYIADRIYVMYVGSFVEVGTVDEIFLPPYHPYTEALLSAIPVANPSVDKKRIRLEGPVPSLTKLSPGCAFYPRCPRVIGDVCETIKPPWQYDSDSHRIRCHIPLKELRRMNPVVTESEDEVMPLDV